MKPPKDLKGSELFSRLIAEPNPSDVVDYPRLGSDGKPIGQLRIRVLNVEDHDAARLEGEAYIQRMIRNAPKEQRDAIRLGEGTTEVLGDAVARGLLRRACQTVDPIKGSENAYGIIFQSTDDLRKLPASEVARLFRLYLMVQHKYGGIEASIGVDDVDLWVELLVEGGETYPLERVSSEMLAELCLRMAQRLVTSTSEESPNSSDADEANSETSTSFVGLQPSDLSTDGTEIDLGEVEKMSADQADEAALALLKK